MSSISFLLRPTLYANSIMITPKPFMHIPKDARNIRLRSWFGHFPSLRTGARSQQNLLSCHSLELYHNRFNGRLPTEIASMRHLADIELHYNFFSGPVPLEWYGLSGLSRLGNLLSGTISVEICNLTVFWFLTTSLLKQSVVFTCKSLSFVVTFRRWMDTSCRNIIVVL